MRGYTTNFSGTKPNLSKDHSFQENVKVPASVPAPQKEVPIGDEKISTPLETKKTVAIDADPNISQFNTKGLMRSKGGPPVGAGEIRSEEGYFWIRVDHTAPYPGQPRKHFPEDEMIVFTKGIEQKGQLKPCLVKRVQHELGVLYQIIGGERRWRAAKRLSWSHIKTVFTNPGDDYEQFEEAVIDNFGGVVPPPLDVADSIAKLWNAPKYRDLSDSMKIEAMSAVFCQSVSWVRYHRSLLMLCPYVRRRLEVETPKKERISVLMGAFIAGVQQPEEQIHLADTAVAQSLSLNQLKEYARRRAASAGYMIGTRARKPVDDYDEFQTFLRRFDEKLALLVTMDHQRIKEMFKRRSPAERIEILDVIRKNGNRLLNIRDILKEFNDESKYK